MMMVIRLMSLPLLFSHFNLICQFMVKYINSLKFWNTIWDHFLFPIKLKSCFMSPYFYIDVTKLSSYLVIDSHAFVGNFIKNFNQFTLKKITFNGDEENWLLSITCLTLNCNCFVIIKFLNSYVWAL